MRLVNLVVENAGGVFEANNAALLMLVKNLSEVLQHWLKARIFSFRGIRRRKQASFQRCEVELLAVGHLFRFRNRWCEEGGDGRVCVFVSNDRVVRIERQ